MRKYYLKDLKKDQVKKIIQRQNIFSDQIQIAVKKIVSDVKTNGLKSAIKYAKKFDSFSTTEIYVTQNEFAEAEKKLDNKLKLVINNAYKNIYKFHKKQLPKNYSVKTTEGVECSRKFVPIENVGLYIPAGTAPLPSTMLMLGIPAQLAGCKRVAAVSPVSDEINPAILFAAKLCGITEFIKLGGAQAISLLAYGDSQFKKVDKIFGPGNQFVATAKSIVSVDPHGCAIDMIAGPSEVLVIADQFADPAFVAADLLSQAEHGKDSLSILVTTSKKLSIDVDKEIKMQIINLNRKEFAEASLNKSFCLIVNNFDEAFSFSNEFAPEHLIVNVKNASHYKNKIVNAGSVFIGKYSAESAGDYASGTNHSLPTYGFAKSVGGVSVEMFMKAITFQTISKKGLNKLASTIVTLAETESLLAHANAVKLRLE